MDTPNLSGAVSRRTFLKHAAIAGGGLIIGFELLPALTAATDPKAAFAPNPFLRLKPDGTVNVIAKHTEMGQGVFTSLAMVVAEELDADWSKVSVEAAPAGAAYSHNAFQGFQITGASSSTWDSFEQMRTAGAGARALLVAAAAQRWGIAAAALRTENSAVIAPDGRRAGYGELLDAAAKLPAPSDVRLKDPNNFKLIGKGTPRIDSREKVTGRAQYGLDVRVPGMLTAVIVRPPVFGGKLQSFDDTATRAIGGVKHVVAIPSGVAVVADAFWPAKKGAEALRIQWDHGALVTLDSNRQREEFLALAAQPGEVARKEGFARNAFAGAAKKIEATYDFPYLAHAAMEPLNATAHVRADGVEIWAPTQGPGVEAFFAAGATGLPVDKITVHAMHIGGGFGRKLNPHSDYVLEAVHVSKAVGAPVQVVWRREDDMKGGYYRPRTIVTAKVGLDAAGKLVSWENHVVNRSVVMGTAFQGMFFLDGVDTLQVEGLADLPYAVPNLRVDYHLAPDGVPVLWWRSVGHSYTGFVKETLIDEAASAAGRDPIDYRIELLAAHPRQVAMLKLLKEKSNWGRPPAGRSQGVAIHESFGSLVAQVAEVSVAGKAIRVHGVTAVVDCGLAVNPAGVRAQIMSGVIFGLSAALYGKITFSQGQVEQGNFDAYPPLRFDEAPVVETHIINSGARMGGIGEPGVPPIGPAVANAVFAATKQRLRSLPLTLA
jgi:isoquinoline 1-oxidoreductase beta subunit